MDEAYKNKLWNEYAATKSSEVREQLILEYAPLVKLVAGRLSMYLGYNVEYDDLVSYGIFGLIDAIDKIDSKPENPGIHSGSDPEDGLDSENHPAEAEED